MWMTNLFLLQLNQEKSTSKRGTATQSASHKIHLPEKSHSTVTIASRGARTTGKWSRLNASDWEGEHGVGLRYGDKCLAAVK